MTSLKPVKAVAFLAEVAARLREMTVRMNRLDDSLVEADIKSRRIEADMGLEFFQKIDRIEAALKASGSRQSLDQWVKKTTGRDDVQAMRRRRQLKKDWPIYVRSGENWASVDSAV